MAGRLAAEGRVAAALELTPRGRLQGGCAGCILFLAAVFAFPSRNVLMLTFIYVCCAIEAPGCHSFLHQHRCKDTTQHTWLWALCSCCFFP